MSSALVCHFSGSAARPDCAHVRQELFIRRTEPAGVCTIITPANPGCAAHPLCRLAPRTLCQGGVGRYRLADFDADLPKVFQEEGNVAVSPSPRGKVTLGRPQEHPAPTAAEPPLTISYPLDGDRFLLEPQAESLSLSLKAVSRTPLRSVTWFRGR